MCYEKFFLRYLLHFFFFLHFRPFFTPLLFHHHLSRFSQQFQAISLSNFIQLIYFLSLVSIFIYISPCFLFRFYIRLIFSSSFSSYFFFFLSHELYFLDIFFSLLTFPLFISLNTFTIAEKKQHFDRYEHRLKKNLIKITAVIISQLFKAVINQLF